MNIRNSPDPAFAQLVEALQKIAEFTVYENRCPEVSRVAHEALKLASEPLRKVAGMTKEGWVDLADRAVFRIQDKACRTLADMLEDS